MQMEIEKITSIIPEAEISQTGETVVKFRQKSYTR